MGTSWMRQNIVMSEDKELRQSITVLDIQNMSASSQCG